MTEMRTTMTYMRGSYPEKLCKIATMQRRGHYWCAADSPPERFARTASR
jgi:hypothetical protein